MTGPWPTEPEIVAFQRRCESFYPPAAASAPIARQREWYNALCRAWDAPRPPALASEDREVEGVPTRRYRLARAGADATILYIHGGGFVLGSLDSHDAICAEIAAAVGAEVVALAYRLAPEHRYPAAAEDCAAVLRALLAEDERVVLCGDSAGGTLAAGLALRAREEGLWGVVGQALI